MKRAGGGRGVPQLPDLFAAADNPASNDLTCERFGWERKGVGMIEDLNEGHYFA